MTDTLAPQSAQAPQSIPTDVQTLIEARLTNEKKSTLLAYVLWFFVESLGGHHFYLGKTKLAVAYLICTLLGFLTVYFGIGFIFFIVVGIGLLIDLFRIPGLVQKNDSSCICVGS